MYLYYKFLLTGMMSCHQDILSVHMVDGSQENSRSALVNMNETSSARKRKRRHRQAGWRSFKKTRMHGDAVNSPFVTSTKVGGHRTDVSDTAQKMERSPTQSHVRSYGKPSEGDDCGFSAENTAAGVEQKKKKRRRGKPRRRNQKGASTDEVRRDKTG
jgi:hypothetical protein